MREIDFRLRLRTRSIDVDVAHDSCDGEPWTEPIASTATNARSNWFFSTPECKRGAFVDDDLRFGLSSIGLRELAAAEQCGADCSEVSGADDSECSNDKIGVGCGRMILHRDAGPIANAHQRRIVYHAGGLNTRQIPDGIQRHLVKPGGRLNWRRNIDGENAFGIEAEVRIEQPFETVDQ